jgi:hypothetical protein
MYIKYLHCTFLTRFKVIGTIQVVLKLLLVSLYNFEAGQIFPVVSMRYHGNVFLSARFLAMGIYVTI